MSNEPELPAKLVEEALAEYVVFAGRVVPLLRAACLHAKKLVAMVPDKGARCHDAERQLYPNFVRLAMHQLIEGHNRSSNKDKGDILKRRHMRNGAVCMVLRDSEFRMLKASKHHPTRPSGRYQEALVTQEAYWDLVGGQSPLIRMDRFILNGLIYYQVKDMELLDAFVVIPSGFSESGGVVHAASQHVAVSEDLDDLAAFDGAEGTITLLPSSNATILSPEPEIPTIGDLDPYSDPSLIGEPDEFAEAADESVFDKEESSNDEDGQKQ